MAWIWLRDLLGKVTHFSSLVSAAAHAAVAAALQASHIPAPADSMSNGNKATMEAAPERTDRKHDQLNSSGP